MEKSILRKVEGTAPVGIDVAIPCYQYGHFLRECVYSLVSQRVPGLRILIIDNASTDNSLEVAQQLAAENPAIEVVAHARNLGPHASFNEAVDWAAQKYFLLLCADDLSAPGALARAIAVLEQHPEVVLSYGRAALIDADESISAETFVGGAADWRILSGEQLLARFCRSGICHIAGCTAVVRTETQKQVGYYRPALPHTDDFELWMRFALHGAAAETSATQGIMRDHNACQSAFVRQQHRWDIQHCGDAFESFFAHEGSAMPDARRLLRLARGCLGARAYWSAISHLSRGDAEEALAIFRIALKLRPSSVLLPPVYYLFRRQNVWERLAEVLSEVGWSQGSARSERAGA